MKKFLFACLCVSVLMQISCKKEDVSFSSVNLIQQQSDGFYKLQHEILNLDVKYVQPDFTDINKVIRKMPSGDTIVFIIYEDYNGVKYGFCGSWFIPNPYVRGFVAAVVGGIASYAEYVDLYGGMSVSVMSNTPLSTVNNFRNLDLRQPINTLAPQQLYNSNIIGKNVGPIHNRVILAAYNANRLDPNHMIDDEDLFNAVSDGNTNPSHLPYEDIAELMHGAHNVSNEQLIETLNNQFSEELEIIDHVYEVSLNLDSVTLFDYTNQVMEIVHDAYVHELISDSSAWLINASVSTLAHTRLLWKSYLPDYRLSTMFMAYIDNLDRWVLCSRSQLASLSSTNQVTYVGIPGIINGKCTEIFFFPSSTFYYHVSNANYRQPYDDVDFLISNNVSFERLISVYNNGIFEYMESGHYRVRNVPNENGITYVSFLEP